MQDDPYQIAADQVLHALKDRRGIGQTLDQIEDGDPEIWQDVRESVALVIRNTLQAEALQEALDDPEQGRRIMGDPDEITGCRRSWAVEQRLAWIKESIEIFGFINRENIEKKFWVSQAQASGDLRLAQERWPGLMSYNTSQKQYLRGAA